MDVSLSPIFFLKNSMETNVVTGRTGVRVRMLEGECVQGRVCMGVCVGHLSVGVGNLGMCSVAPGRGAW